MGRPARRRPWTLIIWVSSAFCASGCRVGFFGFPITSAIGTILSNAQILLLFLCHARFLLPIGMKKRPPEGERFLCLLSWSSIIAMHVCSVFSIIPMDKLRFVTIARAGSRWFWIKWGCLIVYTATIAIWTFLWIWSTVRRQVSIAIIIHIWACVIRCRRMDS